MLCNQLRKPSQSFSEPIFTKKSQQYPSRAKISRGDNIQESFSLFTELSQSFSLLCFRKLHGPQQIFVLIPTKIPKNIDIAFCTEDLEHRNNKSLPAIAVTTNQEDNKAQE